MTSHSNSGTAPDPRKPPLMTARMLCIITGPALTPQRPDPAKQPLGSGWEVVRKRWTIEV